MLACDGEGADSGGGADLGGDAEGAEGTGAFAREFLARVVARFRQTHASSGDPGGAEARVVLSERDAWRLLTGRARDRIRDGLNIFYPPRTRSCLLRAAGGDERERSGGRVDVFPAKPPRTTS